MVLTPERRHPYEREVFVFSQKNFMIDGIRPFSRQYIHHTRRSAYPCLSEWYSQYQELHAALNALCRSHISMVKLIVLLNESFHPSKDQFFEDPIKFKQ